MPRKRSRGVAAEEEEEEVRDVEHGQRKFHDGAIVRITMENFMTYSRVDIHPGPRMNLVAAPNGTGKSSMVCGLCLVLGGDPKLLGRSNDVSGFVKHGADTGFVEAELYQRSHPNIVVRRKIFSKGNESKWYLQGRSSSKKKVLEVVEGLNIQVSNPIHFLPQEKIGRFADLTPQERLKETEKAISEDDELLKKHELLIEKGKLARDEDQAMDQLREKVKRLENDKSALREKVERDKERKALVDRASAMEKKMLVMDLQEKNKEMIGLRSVRDQAQKDIKEAEKQHAPLMKQIEKAKKQVKAAEAVVSKTDVLFRERKEEVRKVHYKVDQQTRRCGEYTSDILENEESLDNKEKVALKNRKKLREMEERLAAFSAPSQEDQVRTCDTEEEEEMQELVRKKIRELEKKLKEIQYNTTNLQHEVMEEKSNVKRAERQLAQLAGEFQKKKDRLRAAKIDANAFSAIDHKREELCQGDGLLLGPLGFHIRIKKGPSSSLVAQYVESALGRRALGAFVTDSPVVQRRVLALREKELGRTGVNLVLIKENERPSGRHCSTEDLERVKGHWLMEHIEVDHPLIRKALIAAWGFHNLAFGPANVNLNRLAKMGITRYFSPGTSYYSSRSRYSVQVRFTTQMSDLTTCGFLANKGRDGVSNVAEEVEQQKAIIQQSKAKMEALGEQIKAFVPAQRSLGKEQAELKSEMERYRNAQRQIRTIKNRIDALESSIEEAEDRTREEKALQSAHNKLEKSMKLRVQHCVDLAKTVQRLDGVVVQLYRARAQVALEREQHHQLDAEMDRCSDSLKECKLNLRAAQSRMDEFRSVMREAKRKALHACGGSKPSAELVQVWSAMPNDVASLRQGVQDLRAKIDTMGSELSAEEYDRFENMCETLEMERESLRNRESSLESERASLRALKESWLVPLKKHIARISRSFGEIFQEVVKNVGDVELVGSGDDFETYGINVRVTFGNLQHKSMLTSSSQSGGEKSVTTMVYLLALRDISKCPLRVVDEINQGMDQAFEEAVFNVVSKIALRENEHSQYFVITPKLLPTLVFQEGTTVLMVFNGAHWEAPTRTFKQILHKKTVEAWKWKKFREFAKKVRQYDS